MARASFTGTKPGGYRLCSPGLGGQLWSLLWRVGCLIVRIKKSSHYSDVERLWTFNIRCNWSDVFFARLTILLSMLTGAFILSVVDSVCTYHFP